MTRGVLLGAVLLLLSNTVVSPQQRNDGNELLVQCKAALKFVESQDHVSASEGEKGMYCLGLVRGTIDTVSLWQESDTVFKNRVSPGRPCLPSSELQTSQGVRVVVKWLNDHPEKLHHDPSLLVINALRDGFPCNNAKP